MLRNSYFPAILSLFFCLWCASSLQAQDLVLNGAFETEQWEQWTLTGNLPSYKRFITSVDIVTPGVYSWCYGQTPWDSESGGLSQTIHMEAGVTYEVSVNFAYKSC